MSQTKFQRDKYKDTTRASELKEADKAVESVTRVGKGNYAGFVNIETGLNTFLIYPSHEAILQMIPGNEEIKSKPFIVPTQKWWLKKEVDDTDKDGNPKKDSKGRVIRKIVPSPVFDARVHSHVKKDVVDLYMKTSEAQLKAEFGDSKEAEKIIKEKMEIFYGNYSKQIKGIVGKPTWVMYVQKVVSNNQRVFGRLDVGKAVKMRINDLIALEESKSPIGTQNNNPFTDLDFRRALLITYDDKAQQAQDYYKTELDTTIDRAKGGIVLTYPLTDADLEEFLTYPSLSKIYEDCYTKKDFDLAVQGLRLFDDENELGIFADESFTDQVAELRELFRDPEEESAETQEEVAEDDEDGDSFQRMDRNELKQFARENQTGIAIIGTMSDDDIRDRLRKWQSNAATQEAGAADLQETFDKRDAVRAQSEKEQTEQKPLSAAERAKAAREKAKGSVQ